MQDVVQDQVVAVFVFRLRKKKFKTKIQTSSNPVTIMNLIYHVVDELWPMSSYGFHCLENVHFAMLNHLFDARICRTINTGPTPSVTAMRTRNWIQIWKIRKSIWNSSVKLTVKRRKLGRNHSSDAIAPPYSSERPMNWSMWAPKQKKRDETAHMNDALGFGGEFYVLSELTLCPNGKHVNWNNRTVFVGALTPAISSVSETICKYQWKSIQKCQFSFGIYFINESGWYIFRLFGFCDLFSRYLARFLPINYKCWSSNFRITGHQKRRQQWQKWNLVQTTSSPRSNDNVDEIVRIIPEDGSIVAEAAPWQSVRSHNDHSWARATSKHPATQSG